jgi:hypothetical protein
MHQHCNNLTHLKVMSEHHFHLLDQNGEDENVRKFSPDVMT